MKNPIRRIASLISGEYKFSELAGEVQEKVRSAVRDNWLKHYITTQASKKTAEQEYADHRSDVDAAVDSIVQQFLYTKDGNVLHSSKKVAVSLKEFTESDWMGFAGAEAPEGGEPLMGELKVEDWPEEEALEEGGGVVVVVDKNGLQIIGLNLWLNHPATSFEEGKKIAEALPEKTTMAELEKMGFTKTGSTRASVKKAAEDKGAKKPEKEEKKEGGKEKTVTEQAIDFIAKAMLPKKDGGMGMSFAEAQAEAYKKFGKGVEKEAIEKLNPAKKRASYGDAYIEADIRKGLTDEQIADKIIEQYPDITREQALKISNNVRTEGDGHWNVVLRKASTFRDRVVSLIATAQEHYRKAGKEPTEDNIAQFIADTIKADVGLMPNQASIKRILSTVRTGVSEPSEDNPVAICPKCKGKATKNELENFGGVCAECWEEAKRTKRSSNLLTLHRGTRDVRTLEAVKKQAQRNRLLAVLNDKKQSEAAKPDPSQLRERLANSQLIETQAKLEQTKKAHKVAKLMTTKGMIESSQEDEVYSKLITCSKDKFEAVELVVEAFKPVQRSPQSLRESRIASIRERIGQAAANQMTTLPGATPEEEGSLDSMLDTMFQ